MPIEDITLDAAQPSNMTHLLKQFADRYRQDGVVILRNFLQEDATFQWLIRDLKRLTRELAHEAQVDLDDNMRLDQMISILAAERRDLVGRLYDIGTRPNKLLSGMALKMHPSIFAMTKAVFPIDAVIATPSLSDTLHIFPPGKDSYRFNLPVHQDYPYLLQSPNQITFWISLSEASTQSGGMTVWKSSHKLGIIPQRRDKNGHIECAIRKEHLDKFEEIRVEAGYGDVVVFHSNILHRSEKNVSTTDTRIVQLYRYSDLMDHESLKLGWASADVHAKAKKFEDIYPDKMLKPAGKVGA